MFLRKAANQDYMHGLTNNENILLFFCYFSIYVVDQYIYDKALSMKGYLPKCLCLNDRKSHTSWICIELEAIIKIIMNNIVIRKVCGS